MTEWLAVFFGGGLGAMIRWQCQSQLNYPDQIPWGTFFANMVGGLIAGVFLALAQRLSNEVKLFVVTGVLGGLTTFSALSAEMVSFAGRGLMVQAFVYGAGSLLLGFSLCGLGYWVTLRF